MKSSKRLKWIKQIHQRGMYVSHLLRHHLKSEGDYLSQAIHEELAPEAREKITARLRAL